MNVGFLLFVDNCCIFRLEDAVIGEDVIVVSPGSWMHDRIGRVWKVGTRGEQLRVSVSFDGDIYNFGLEELALA